MKYKELEEIVNVIKKIRGAHKQEEVFQMMMQAKKEKTLIATENPTKEEKSILLKFTIKEISRIPMRFRKDFLVDGKVVHCQKRKSGKKTTNYMLRYRRNGFNICATSNDLEEAKRKFIQAMQKAVNQESAVKFGKMNMVPTDFHGFAEYYFEKYRKRKVSEKTFENDKYRYKNHLQPRFGKMQLSEITPFDCQEFLDGYEKQEKHKTTRELYSLLNCIFKMAMAHGIIERNPLAVVIVLKYEEKHGKALTKEEEKLLLEESKGTKYQQIFALSLYTGLRPNELFTAKIDGNFIVAKNSKRKGKKVEYKKIPISIMLKPYLEKVENFEFPTLEYIRKAFNQILPNHIYYDLRTTFYTRCEECGVAPPARDHFVGHSNGVLNSTYTDLSDEYLLKEGAKLVW